MEKVKAALDKGLLRATRGDGSKDGPGFEMICLLHVQVYSRGALVQTLINRIFTLKGPINTQ
jgi:hypothetical protein